MTKVPRAEDIPTPSPPGRVENSRELSAALYSLYLTVLVANTITKETRGALVTWLDSNASLSSIEELTQSISNPPTQAEVQTLQAKVNEVVGGLNSLQEFVVELYNAVQAEYTADVSIAGVSSGSS